MSKGLLAGQVAIVTGGSRGIGAAICKAYGQEGARVAVCYQNNKEMAEAVAVETGNGSFVVQMEVTDRASVEDTLAAVRAEAGEPHILVNNAGYLHQLPFRDIDDEEWQITIDTNMKGVFLCSQIIGGALSDLGRGAIVNLSSVGGQMGGPKAPHYAATKAAVISLTKSLARHYSPNGVRVNAIAPGFIRTDMYEHILARASEEEVLAGILMGRVGEPEDVADAAVFLASEKSSYITGHVLNVNGGQYFGAGM